MIDPDPSFIRRIELYQASQSERQVAAYLVMYSDSIEEQKFLDLVRKEKDGFEQLIKERANMVITLEDTVKNPMDSLEASLTVFNRGDSRIAGGQLLAGGGNKVIPFVL